MLSRSPHNIETPQTELEKYLSARVKTLEKALKAATDELNNMRVLLQNELNRHADQ